MENKTAEDFYNSLKIGNAISSQQANDLVRLSLTAQVTTAIANGEDTDRIKSLIELMKEMK